MKEEDLNNIALQILRSDGNNNWQNLVDVCNSMKIVIHTSVISSDKQFKCRFHLNSFNFPDDGIGSTKLDSKCNAVAKFLNRYVNISKVSSCNKYTENNRDFHVNIVPNGEIIKNVANQINQSDERNVLVKLANLCISKYTGDLWSLLYKYTLLEKIKFYPKFSRYHTEHSCSFVFNNIIFEDRIVIASSPVDAGRMLAEKFVRSYTSNYKEYERKMESFFIFIARECQLSRRNESSKTLSSICEYLNIDSDKLITQTRDKYICKLILNHKQCPIVGEGSTENEAFISAIEMFFDKCFSPEILREIQRLNIMNKIVNFSATNKFADDWKSICNSCKLLGYKCHERFTQGNNTFSAEFFVDNVNCELIGTGQTRNEAAISLGKQFIEKFKNLKELLIGKINRLDEERFFLFVATLCVETFWSYNWSVLTKICSQYKISLLRCVKNEVNNQIRCSIFLGIYTYEKFVTLSNHDLAFNIVTQHFLTKYGRRNLSENDKKELMKEIAEIGINNANKKSDEATNENKLKNHVLNMNVSITNNNEILSNEEILFRRIAAYCISNPKSDDWKTLCNACKCLKQSVYEKFTIYKSNIVLCEVYINYQKINISEMSENRKTAARTVAEKFINKYFCGNFNEPKPSVKTSNFSINNNTNSEQIFKNIAKHFINNNDSNIWDSFCKTCELLNYKMEESCESDGIRFVSQVFVENIPFDFTGKDSTRRGAKLSFVKQFLDRFYTSNEFSKSSISEENSSTQSDEKTEFSKSSISEENSSTKSDEKIEFSKSSIPEEIKSTQSDENTSSMISLDSEKMLNKIANFCLFNPIKNDWKTLCNACLSLRCKMIGRFISHDSNQFECEIYLNGNLIKCGVKCFTRVDAQICTAKFFIEKYATIHKFSKSSISEENSSTKSDEKIEFSKSSISEENSSTQSDEIIEFSKSSIPEENSSTKSDEKTDDQDEALYLRIASLCQSNPYKDNWKALCNTCKLNKYKYREQIYREQNEFWCKLFIEDKLLDLVGRGNSELKAAIDLAEKFMEKYYKPKESDFNQNLAPFSFQELKIDSVIPVEKPVTIQKTSDLKQDLSPFSFQELKIDSVIPVEKPVTIQKTSDLKQDLSPFSFQELKIDSVIPVEKPVTIQKNAKYEGTYFMTY